MGGSKVAAVGIRARRWVTYHGLALNVTTDLEPYKYIIPCGIADKPVTSVSEILQQNALLSGSANVLIKEYAAALLEVFQEVFNCQTCNEQELLL